MVCAAVALTAACGGGERGGGGISSAIQGTWMRCEGAATTSLSLAMAFAGAGFTQTVRTYSTPACTGAPTSEFIDSGTFVLGAAVTTTADGASVTAYELDVTIPGDGTSYDLVYVDTAATPDRLAIGDLSGGRDGNSPAQRPIALDPVFLTRR